MKGALLRTSVIVVAVALTFVSKANTRYVQAWYTNSFNPGACTANLLPDGCTTDPSTGTYCTAPDPLGGTRRYFANTSCTLPYYKRN